MRPFFFVGNDVPESVMVCVPHNRPSRAGTCSQSIQARRFSRNGNPREVGIVGWKSCTHFTADQCAQDIARHCLRFVLCNSRRCEVRNHGTGKVLKFGMPVA
jgi:hypothetical protein